MLKENKLQNKFVYIYQLLRLDRPTGYFLLFWPCAFSIALYSSKPEHYLLFYVFFVGSVVMRSAGCIINDMWDRNIDKYVFRTKERPIASEKISIPMASSILLLCLMIGLVILIQLSLDVILLGIATIPLIVAYPLMKRITFFPQLFLGVTFNFGVLLVAVQINGAIDFSSMSLYIACIFWTLAYDTIYGFLDYKDDKKIGIKSLAIYLEQRNYKKWLTTFYLSFCFFAALSKYLFYGYFTYFDFILIILFSVFLKWQIDSLNIQDIQNCINRFRINLLNGLLLTIFFM